MFALLAEPSATQLIVQFLEHSGLFNINVVGVLLLSGDHTGPSCLQHYDHELQVNLLKKIFFLYHIYPIMYAKNIHGRVLIGTLDQFPQWTLDWPLIDSWSTVSWHIIHTQWTSQLLLVESQLVFHRLVIACWSIHILYWPIRHEILLQNALCFKLFPIITKYRTGKCHPGNLRS